MSETERRTAVPRIEVRGGEPDASANSSPNRALIFHYHLFKNAGTSVDELLRGNFGRRWIRQEFHVGRRENAGAVIKFLSDNPHIAAISSHTALLPVPRIEGVEIFPILFVRHPIDRLRSAYDFERSQIAGTLGARLAKDHDFPGYIRELLGKKHHRQARNFQTFRLSQNEPKEAGTELERALRAVKAFEFVGLVESYDRSIGRLEQLLGRLFPEFRASVQHKNATPLRPTTLEDRLATVRERLGSDLYSRLTAANRDDATLYDFVRSR